MLHGFCIVKNAKLYLKSAVSTFCAEEVQMESSVLYQSGNNKYYYNFFNDSFYRASYAGANFWTIRPAPWIGNRAEITN